MCLKVLEEFVNKRCSNFHFSLASTGIYITGETQVFLLCLSSIVWRLQEQCLTSTLTPKSMTHKKKVRNKSSSPGAQRPISPKYGAEYWKRRVSLPVFFPNDEMFEDYQTNKQSSSCAVSETLHRT